MIHVMCGALLSAPLANFCAQLADFLVKRAVARHRIGAQAANGGALDATRGTVVGTGFPNHVREAVPAFGRAVITGRDAIADCLG